MIEAGTDQYIVYIYVYTRPFPPGTNTRYYSRPTPNYAPNLLVIINTIAIDFL